MKRRSIVIGLIGLLVMSALLVAIALAQGITAAKEAPADATVVKAFSKPDAACQGLMEWTVHAGSDDWIDVGIEWIAVDEATAQDNWRNISFVISVDGQEIVDPKSYEHGPAPAKVECPEFAVEGGGMALTIFLPPLAVGDHQVTWQVSFAADVNDGWADYPMGTIAEFTGTVRVAPATLPQTGGAIGLMWALMSIVSGGLALLAGLGLRRRR